jgi:hypothetical protein
MRPDRTATPTPLRSERTWTEFYQQSIEDALVRITSPEVPRTAPNCLEAITRDSDWPDDDRPKGTMRSKM